MNKQVLLDELNVMLHRDLSEWTCVRTTTRISSAAAVSSRQWAKRAGARMHLLQRWLFHHRVAPSQYSSVMEGGI
jgi:hypothetical protein